MARFTTKSVNGPLIARIGLAACFLYAGVSALVSPFDWIGFIPQWVVQLSPLPNTLLLQLHSLFEIFLGLFLLIGWQPRTLGVVAALDLLVILGLNGINSLTFRDIGLVALSLVLVF